MSETKHRVYMRDWYFNAGIVGFLITVCDGRPLEQIEKEGLITVGENYVEIDDLSLLDGFYEKFKKRAFLNLFSIDYFISKISGTIKKLEEESEKKKPKIKTIIKDNLKKTEMENFFKLMDYEYDDSDEEKLKESLEQILENVRSFNKENTYHKILSRNGGEDYIEDVLSIKTKGILSFKNIESYTKSIQKEKPKKLANKDICISCQNAGKKAENYFTNAVSNVIGFNTDNTNWIWGYKTANMKLCNLCTLIYSCAFVSFAYLNKKVGKDYLNFFYFINYNTSLKSLYKQVLSFRYELSIKSDGESSKRPFFAMIKQTVNIIKQEQSKQVKDNVNFIEVMENPIISGQSSKGYNVYNYNIDYDLATFLDKKLDRLPGGFYINNKAYFNIEDELLSGTLMKRLSFNDINRYLSISISKMFKKKFSTISITKYIFDFIEHLKGGVMKDNKEKIYKRGFRNGKELRMSLLKKKTEKQIDGIAYRILNDLKIADRDKFLDKYTRLMMGNDLFLSFGRDEMNDTDSFLHFGYSFVNGLLSREKEETTDKEKNQ
jgi:CRISPR-associated protein Cst1